MVRSKKPSIVRAAGEASVFFTWQKPHAELYERSSLRDRTSVFEQRMRFVHFRTHDTGEAYCVGEPPPGRACWADYYLCDGGRTRVSLKNGQREACVWEPGASHVLLPTK